MWFTFITARLFISVSFQPRLAATLLTLRSVANSPTQRVGLSPTFRSTSLAQHPCPSVVKTFFICLVVCALCVLLRLIPFPVLPPLEVGFWSFLSFWYGSLAPKYG